MKKNDKKSNKDGIQIFLKSFEGKDPIEIDWVSLARKANTETLETYKDEKIISGIDLYRKFINDKILSMRSEWNEADESDL